MKIGDACYYFDINRRVYEDESGNKSAGAIYEKHFVPFNIIAETDKEFITDLHSSNINKRSGLLNIGKKVKVFSQEEKDDKVWLDSKKYKIIDVLKYCNDVSIFKAIAKLLNIKE